MIELAEIFQSGMTIQREKPFTVWGTSECAQTIEVTVNNKRLGIFTIPKGDFKITLPAQNTLFDATVKVGDVTLCNVDFGEVWLAGGQSNMQFYVKWDAERELVYAEHDDPHFRYYEVGKYTFDGEKREGLKDGSRWDKWFGFDRKNSPYFSSTATFFALMLRKKLDCPIAIVSCNFGGTSASTWLDESILRADDDLKVYTDEYDRQIENLDLDKYYKINRFLRFNSFGNEAADDYLHRNEGVTPQDFYAFMAEHPHKQVEGIAVDIEGFSMDELGMTGPNDPHPGSLYRTMFSTVSAFVYRGVIWYQGCSDNKKAELYGKLLSALIDCWRRDMNDCIPFVIGQLVPFGSWWGDNGENFPIIRAAQNKITKSKDRCYLVSTSDIGSETDIHPKYKRKIGERMAYQAFDKVYGIAVPADAPEPQSAIMNDGVLEISFAHTSCLSVSGDKINALRIIVDVNEAEDYSFTISGNKLCIASKRFYGAKNISAEFATTAYYCVNLYNEAGIPAVPFSLTVPNVTILKNR